MGLTLPPSGTNPFQIKWGGECGERRIFYSIQPRHRHGFPRRFPRVTGTHEWIRRQPLAVRDVIPVRLANRSLTHIRGPSPCVGGPMRAVDTSWKPSTVEFPSVEPQDGGFGIERPKRIDVYRESARASSVL